MKRTLTVTLDAPGNLDNRRVAQLLRKLLQCGTELFADIIDDDRRIPANGPVFDEQDAMFLSDFQVSIADEEPFKDAIDQIRSILWHTPDGWNPEKQWDSETIEYVAGVLEDLGVKPRKQILMKPRATSGIATGQNIEPVRQSGMPVHVEAPGDETAMKPTHAQFE